MSNKPKPVAIVAAMPVELAPLIGAIQPESINGVDLFELPQAVVAVGGIGERFARRAAEVALEYAQPEFLVSAGIVGAVSPRLKVGEVGRIRQVVDVATGMVYSTNGGGEWLLATAQDVSGAAEKRQLLAKFGADVVDMEGAAVAQVAKERGVKFAAVKAISDEADCVMPPLTRFVEQNGKFAARKFLLYAALHPKWWAALGRIKTNSEIASANLCKAVGHLIENSDQWLVASG